MALSCLTAIASLMLKPLEGDTGSDSTETGWSPGRERFEDVRDTVRMVWDSYVEWQMPPLLHRWMAGEVDDRLELTAEHRHLPDMHVQCIHAELQGTFTASNSHLHLDEEQLIDALCVVEDAFTVCHDEGLLHVVT